MISQLHTHLKISIQKEKKKKKLALNYRVVKYHLENFYLGRPLKNTVL